MNNTVDNWAERREENDAWPLTRNRHLEHLAGDAGPSRHAWQFFALTAQRFAAMTRPRTCSAVLESERKLADRTADQDAPLPLADVYVDDPRMDASCYSCHQERGPFLPGEEAGRYPSTCSACGAGGSDTTLKWRSVQLIDPKGFVVSTVAGERGRLTNVQFSAPLCGTCWPREEA